MRRCTRPNGTPPDPRDTHAIAEARTTAQAALSATEWADAYTRGQDMTILDALAEAIASTTDHQL
jgi:hypothetical protein